MKTLFTTLLRTGMICLLSLAVTTGAVFAQGIVPPDSPSDLQPLPHRFNVDMEEIDWDGYTMYPFEGAGMIRLENPDKSGINTTEFVIEYKKGGAGMGGQAWAGFFYHTDGPMEITDESVFRLKVWSYRANVRALLKLEMKEYPDVNTGDIFVTIPVANEWVQLEWDLSGVDASAPYDRVVMIMDLEGGAGDASDNFTWYLDDFEFISGTPSSVERLDGDIPSTIQLNQNYPNPFNPSTQISFSLPNETHAVLEVFNMMGQRVAVLVDGTMSAGRYTANFNAENMASGIYMYRLQAGNQVVTRKMSLVK